jgi:hypothetical protein
MLVSAILIIFSAKNWTGPQGMIVSVPGHSCLLVDQMSL